jgi:hypothetical protein
MNRDFASGAALAGALLVAMPFLDLLVGGESALAVRAVIGTCGLGLLALAAALKPVKVRS